MGSGRALAIAVEIDLSGLNCPLPVLRTKKAMATMAEGDILAVRTTDPTSAQDIPAFAKMAGHALVRLEETASGHLFLLRK